MSDYIDTREGWREVDAVTLGSRPDGAQTVTWWDGEGWRYLIRDEPVPPLPTEPWTSVKVAWREVTNRDPFFTYRPRRGNDTNDGELMWVSSEGPANVLWLSARIRGFETLAVPPMSIGQAIVHAGGIEQRVRRETAKAVLDRVAKQAFHDGWYASVAREFDA